MTDFALKKAVLAVYDEIAEEHYNQGIPERRPGGENWTLHQHDQAKELVRKVANKFLEIHGQPCLVIEGPAIPACYITIRKMGDDGRDRLRKGDGGPQGEMF